mmetsp:Transcript_4696/g.16827  ORF Transcript_4696/g.16827 Transcript_4696/m.16827 type:complete len:100 (-) Transcript_4696:637-936(-)
MATRSDGRTFIFFSLGASSGSLRKIDLLVKQLPSSKGTRLGRPPRSVEFSFGSSICLPVLLASINLGLRAALFLVFGATFTGAGGHTGLKPCFLGGGVV